MPPRAPRPPHPRGRCEACLDLEYDKFEALGSYSSYQTSVPRYIRIPLFMLINSKKKGCQVCFAILKGLDHMTQELLPPPTPPRTEHGPFAFINQLAVGARQNRSAVTLIRRPNSPLEVTAELFFQLHFGEAHRGRHFDIRPGLHSVAVSSGDSVRFGFEIYVEKGKLSPWDGFGPARHVTPRLNERDRIPRIGNWIKMCNDSHPLCGFSSSSAPIPARRVLDLGGNYRNAIKLVDVAATDAKGPYATLSHAWGGDPSSILQLRSETLGKMSQRIRWKDLPPSFQNAVVVAGEQNISYLWIDALCILQDNEKDKAWHVENMHHIYGESYLNIALTRSPDSRDSLVDRWTNGNRICPLQRWEIELTKFGKKHIVFARPKLYDCHSAFESVEPLYFYNSKIFSGYTRAGVPLFGRAWALQERILARRTVHFHVSEMVWECYAGTTCECSYATTAAEVANSPNDTWRPPYSIAKLRAAFKRPREDRSAMRRLWREMCELYTSLETHDPTERLNAMVGLATHFQPLLDKTFVAGSFVRTLKQLTEDLIWQVDRGRDISELSLYSPSGYDTRKIWSSKLPSWSWISVFPRPVDGIRAPEALRSGDFVRDKDFKIFNFTMQAYPGGEPDHLINGTDWTLHVKGRLINGKISIRERGMSTYQFMPSNLQQFPPAFPPPRRPTVLRIRSDSDSARTSSAPVPQNISSGHTTVHLPPFLPWTQSTDATAESESRPASSDNDADILQPHRRGGYPLPEPAPLRDADNLASMGLFTPDCDRWDRDRKDPTGSVGFDGTATREHSYAYFLLLGQIYSKHDRALARAYAQQQDEDDDRTHERDGRDHLASGSPRFRPLHIGIALRRADPRIRTWGSRPTFERIGMFTVPVETLRFFDEAEVQEVMLV